MLHLLVIYDIPDDRVRAKAAVACEDYGLDRIQYSAFYGRLSWNHQEELMLRIAKILGKRPGKVQLIPVGTAEWKRRIELINDTPTKELAADGETG